jgi:hypothetical protein
MRISQAETFGFRLLCVDVIDCSIEIVGKQESIRPHAENAAWSTLDLSVHKESGDEVAWFAIVLGEAHHAITRADLDMAGAVKRDQKRVGQGRVV